MPDDIRDRLVGPAADEALAWLGLTDDAAAEVRAVARRIADDPALIAEQEKVHAVLKEAMGIPRPWEVVHLPRRYNPDDGDAPALDRWWYLVAAMAFVPDTLAFHRDHGIPEDVSRRTLADAGLHVRLHRRMYGRSGFGQEGWISIHLRGLLYDLGRLQFNLTTLRLPTEQIRAAGLPLDSGTVVLDTHIPESGPLRPDDVAASLARARAFFTEHFPQYAPYDYAICNSWLLDPQLQQLVPGTNIDAFCRVWTPLDPGVEADISALNFIFRRPGMPLADLPRDSTLHRAVIDHMSAGGHLIQAMGYVAM